MKTPQPANPPPRFRLIALVVMLILAAGLYWIVRGDRLNAAMIDAALHGDEALERNLLAKGADANLSLPLTTQPKNVLETLQDGLQGKRTPRLHRTMSLLMYAAASDKTDLARDLLARGADIRYTLENGNSALLYSAMARQSDCLELLIANHADIRQTNRDGQTPLHVAAQHGRFECARALLDHGAPPSVQDKGGKTPLQYAYSGSYPDIVMLLLERGANFAEISKVQPHPLVWAAQEGNLPFLQTLWSRYVTGEERNRLDPIALAGAIGRDRVNTMQFLFGKGVNLSQLPLVPVYTRPPMPRTVTVSTTTRMGIAPGTGGIAFGGSAKSQAMLRPVVTGVNYILTRHQRSSPLVPAIWAADRTMFDLLLTKGADVNAPDANGNTPLIAAASAISSRNDPTPFPGNQRTGKETLQTASLLKMVEILLAKGAEVQARNQNGDTALMAATNSPELTRILLRNHADVNAQNLMGETALSRASGYNANIKTVQLLLGAGANVNSRDQSGRTPLVNAALANKADVVNLLLKHGAQANVKDAKGNSLMTLLSPVGTTNATPDHLLSSQFTAMRSFIKAAGGK